MLYPFDCSDNYFRRTNNSFSFLITKREYPQRLVNSLEIVLLFQYWKCQKLLSPEVIIQKYPEP